ncbi:MAG TPA: T9SS type A sorting domain-containing protein, partial [Chitinophagales bacterium]|nr:T9SS type A sorting domain-containing protein [Chitinophagales bacterium]
NGKLYIAYEDHAANNSNATVMTFNGSNWLAVGSTGFSSDAATYESIAIDNNNVPYIAFSDYGANNGYAATVMKFDGNNWVNVGSQGFTPGEADFTTLAFDKNNTLYLAYSDAQNSYKASVEYFNGTTWVNKGAADFSSSEADYISLVADGSGNLYTGYVDFGNSHATTVKKFAVSTNITGVTDINLLQAYPNPCNGNFNVTIETARNEIVEIGLYDLCGREVWGRNGVQINGKETLVLSTAGNVAPGLYLLKVKTSEGFSTMHLEIE